MGVFVPTVEAAYRASVVAPYSELKTLLGRCERYGVASALLAATAWQCEGDVLRAESTLRRAAEQSAGHERACIIDTFVPLLISRGVFSRAAGFLAAYDEATAREGFEPLAVARVALRSVIDAANGATRCSAGQADEAREGLARIDDDVLRMRIHQRLALAAYYRGDMAAALDHVDEGLRLASLLDAKRFAVTLHSVAYAVHQTSSGDADAAWSHALALANAAEQGGDASYRGWSNVVLFELAAERGDDAEVARIRAAIDAHPLPEQYRERFAAGIAQALRFAWLGDFATSRNVLAVLKDGVGRSAGQRSLCRALGALCALGLGDDEGARRLARQAISGSARPERRMIAEELRYHRLARALAAATGETIGDIVRGRRAAAARFLREDQHIARLASLRPGVRLEDVHVSVRGYARVLLLARERYEARPAAGPLTPTEIEILRLVDAGRKAPDIALLLDRSPHTVRTHLRNVSAKLETHSRTETLARARQLGVLDTPVAMRLGGGST